MTCLNVTITPASRFYDNERKPIAMSTNPTQRIQEFAPYEPRAKLCVCKIERISVLYQPKKLKFDIFIGEISRAKTIPPPIPRQLLLRFFVPGATFSIVAVVLPYSSLSYLPNHSLGRTSRFK